HIHVTSLVGVLYALATLWRAQQPVVFRVPNPPSTNLARGKQQLSDFIWRHCVDRVCSVLVCNSHYTLSQLERVGVKSNKARLIYNCVSERGPAPASDLPKVNPEHFNIVYLGRIRPEKG